MILSFRLSLKVALARNSFAFSGSSRLVRLVIGLRLLIVVQIVDSR